MNLKNLARLITQEKLWHKPMKDFSEDNIVSLINLIARHAWDRSLYLGDMTSAKDPADLKRWFNAFRNEIKGNIWADELLSAYAIRFEELKCPKSDPRQLCF